VGASGTPMLPTAQSWLQWGGVMSDDVSVGVGATFSWKAYSVSARYKEPLLQFIREALELRGCTIRHASAASRAPFHLVVDLPGGERLSVLVYAFFANSEPTRNRPADEHRFQIKYGGNLKGVLDVAVDPLGVVTTIFLGIDPKRRIFVAADPRMNSPSPMSRSIEFKAANVDCILADGWSAWERDRREPKTTTRRAVELDPDVRTEVLIGGRQEQLLDLILLERVANNVAGGLDPGERHLLADKFRELPGKAAAGRLSHKLLDELNLAPEALLDLIASASRLKMAVRGWVAESHYLSGVDGISECVRLQGDGKPDISLRWKGGRPLLVECKNVLRTTYADGVPKLDFQRTRAAKSDPCSRYYARGDFDIVAACLHPVTERWEFRFALTSFLPAHSACDGRIDSNIRVGGPAFLPTIQDVLEASARGAPST
jgi:hypothetical protein